MESTLLFVAMGAVFILLGSWLYRNPRRLTPGWGILNRDHPGVQKVARAYATFFIFFGSFALAAIASVRLRVPGTPLVGLAAAIGLTWLIRSRLKQSVAVPTASFVSTVAGPVQIAPKQPLLSSHWKRNLLIAIGLAVVLVAVVMSIIGDSDVSKMALAAAQSSPSVKQQLGEPIKRGFFTSGSIEVSGPSGKADISIPISGPKGKATVYAVARKSAGLWKLETLLVSFKEESARVDLLKEAVGSARP
jgi:hypothetical protein